MRRTRSYPARLLAALLCAAAAGAISAHAARATGLIYLNEIVIQGAEEVELYNPSSSPIDISGWFIHGSAGTDTIPAGTSIGGDSYKTIGIAHTIFLDTGGETSIADGADRVQDLVLYGQAGGAPLPPPGATISLARAPDASLGPPFFNDPGYSDAGNWTIDLTSTFGAMNDVPAPALGSGPRINEVHPAPGANAVEFYNPTAIRTPVNLAGWYLIDGLNVINLSGTIPSLGVLALNLPAQIDVTQLAYLFDNTNVRVDQIGLLGAAIPQDQCAARCPDGAGPADGFDFVTSGGGVTLFVTTCTLGQLNSTNPACHATPVRETSWGKIRLLYR